MQKSVSSFFPGFKILMGCYGEKSWELLRIVKCVDRILCLIFNAITFHNLIVYTIFAYFLQSFVKG